jgi:hypothetical protein
MTGVRLMRTCGECTLCCRLVPVASLNKPGGVRCKHQRFRTGCAIYRKEGFPIECGLWSCRWLMTDIDVPRPDRAHYCIDIVPDYITARDNRGGGDITQPVIQIWVDPHYPEAHRDPRLRAWLEAMSLEGWCALIRFSPSEAMLLIPPLMSSTGRWEEAGAGRMTCADSTHSAEDIAAKLNSAGILP